MNEIRKTYNINKIFNFRKELKTLKVRKQKQTFQENECTFLGKNRKKPVLLPDDMKHCFICGTTGSGKTVALGNFIKRSSDMNYPLLIVDGKGDTGKGSILDVTRKLCKGRKLYVVNMTSPDSSAKYNPFMGANATIVKDMLINMTEWSEEHYKLNTERYLQRLVMLMVKSEIPLSFSSIIQYMPVKQFDRLSADLLKAEQISKQEHLSNIEISKACGKISENASARFSTIVESEIGTIFGENGIDIFTAMKENAVILFILNPLLYPELSPLLGRLILIDAKKAISKLFNRNIDRSFFIFDEINVYASPVLVDLVNKSRSANVTSILASQSLSDLDFNCGEAFKEQIIENCNNYLVLRQNSSVNAEQWAKILGTRATLEVTYQLDQQNKRDTRATGLGSAKRVREFLYHPDDIKNLSVGKGIFMSKDYQMNSNVSINNPL